MAEIWTVQRALNWTRDYLARHDDPNPRLSAEWLLAHATGLSRIQVYAQFDRPLSPDERNTLRDGVSRRAAAEPLQYITGKAAFRHLDIVCKPPVLIPRPETEVLVDLANEYIAAAGDGGDGRLRVLDLCTGTGCVGLAVAQENPQVTVTAVDIDPAAVALAAENAAACDLTDRYTVHPGDVRAWTRGDAYDLVIANPPYVPTNDWDVLPREVAGYESRTALDGGVDGLDLARVIVRDVVPAVARSGRACGLLMELDPRNVAQAAQLAVQLEWYQSVEVKPDLTGRERFLACMRNRHERE
ncbi:MAG: peptide chain release factor N(5)-glutamine methyltransferase [Actinomycetes bacterium]|jgi:release factor glutamine methyltransferase|nr:peptide chain release factor N(5)-glutamine methyltransferase [Actinomycetes bacterium]